MYSHNNLAPQMFNPKAHAKQHFNHARFSYQMALGSLSVLGLFSLLGWV